MPDNDGFDEGFTERVVPLRAPLVLTSAQFVQGFTPPDYLIDGIIQKGKIYSLTARTNHGKTAVVMYGSQVVARGILFHSKEVSQGAVLFFAGENPDDVRARWLVLADHEGFDVNQIPVHFVAGVLDIATNLAAIDQAARRISNLALVVVDTAAAYFRGDEANSNTQQGAYARMLRKLTELPGKPAAIINCHPIKNAAQDNLLPMGGSAFVNEVDGNLTLWAEEGEKQTRLHWQGKFRGPEFEPLTFELRSSTSDKVRDSKGRHLTSVVALPITEAVAERRADVASEDDKTILRLMHVERNASFMTLARNASFFLPDGSPAKARVQRVIHRLAESKFIVKYDRHRYRLTKKGCRHIKVAWEDDD